MTDKLDGRFLKVISTPEEIWKHPLNNSLNKQFCLFSKTEWFLNDKNQSTDILSYEIKRDFFNHAWKTTFGYGEKYNFT